MRDPPDAELHASTCTYSRTPGCRVIDALVDAVLVVDPHNRVLEANRAAREFLGLVDEGAAPVELRSACPELDHLLCDRGRESGEFSLGGPASIRRDYEVLVSAFEPEAPRCVLRAVVIRDVTARSRSADDLHPDRYAAGLTELESRLRFGEQVADSIAAARAEGHAAALLHVELDRLRDINESLGQAVGDGILRAVAARLRYRTRDGDAVQQVDKPSPAVSVSRVRADSIAVLLSRIPSSDDVGAVASRILAAVAEPVAVEGLLLSTTASIGVAVFPQDADTAEGLARCAEAALRQASERGGASFEFFQPEFDARMERRLAVELRLRQAVVNQALVVHYQPKISLESDRVVGGEALLRWHDEELGTVSPVEFIPLAERVGLIAPIGSFVIDAVCQQLRAWQHEGYERVPIAVNVSVAQLAQTDLRRVLTEALERHDVEPHWLEVEITESVPLTDAGDTAAVLRQLRSMGIRVTLDDFGTGYSALSYLPAFPLDSIKLDRSLVSDLAPFAPAARVAEGVISIAHGLGLEVVAEGVEKADQVRLLRDMRCDQFQGFVVSGALPPDEFKAYLRRQRTTTDAQPSGPAVAAGGS